MTRLSPTDLRRLAEEAKHSLERYIGEGHIPSFLEPVIQNNIKALRAAADEIEAMDGLISELTLGGWLTADQIDIQRAAFDRHQSRQEKP